jgi:ubiquinone biosynthesis protein
MPFETVRGIVEEALGRPLETLFARFEAGPMAAATIAQVHEAALPDGRHVVVKVRRAGLDQRIAEDTATLTYLAAAAERLVPRLRGFDVVGLVREFRATLRRETDLRLEGETIRRFRAACADVAGLWIPDALPELTAPAVLTLEFSSGQRVDRYAEAHPEVREALAQAVAALVLHQVFETGLFNADPHPGNVFVLPDGRLCLHDFGMIGELDEPTREAITAVLDGAVRGDAKAVTDAYLELGLVAPDVDRAALEADLVALLRKIRERPLAEVSIGDALTSLARVGSEHQIRNPGALLLLARAFLIAEAVLRRLDPAINVVEAFRIELERVFKHRYSPARLLAAARQAGVELDRLLRAGPADLRRLLRRVGDGELGRVSAPALEQVAQRASRDLERLTGALGSAAMLVAGALLVSVGGGHRVLGDVLLVAGTLGTVATGIGAFAQRRRKARP